MNNKWELFQRFLITQEEQIQVADFIINSIIILVLALLMAYTYNKCGKSLSDRKSFSANFLLIGFATMLIISIVKSSLALSLGLVGALSIIRFRAAIKEPEELSYLFIMIALGLGLGANLRLITVVAFVIIAAIIWGRYFFEKQGSANGMYLTVSNDTTPVDVNVLQELIKKYFNRFELKRMEDYGKGSEFAYLLETVPVANIENFKKDLAEHFPGTKVVFMDNKIF